ncbi:VOC family protein [Tenacibaculum aiptasiae]|uniref:VOC family protein n=1 Tax=Tenacibaculum aiptasiae TaxID=426481 RepID=UPI00232AE2F8|nr:VOC family protein [Tenacibaculum aiptasiae]
MENISTLLVVQNLKASLVFFVDVLGLTLEEENEDSIKLKCGQHSVIMFQGTMMSVEYEHGYNSNSTLLITVTDLDKKIAELKSKGVIFIHTTPNENKWGRYAAFKDPSGIVHELFQLHN